MYIHISSFFFISLIIFVFMREESCYDYYQSRNHLVNLENISYNLKLK